uniref:SH3 domain-containing protein n=1 Tax=Trichobilharzia regenti TaxID=157069 RepID=A0AA85J0E5_TRIRE|nr:unnamed protein product [Trichobilharzia regenti]
MLQNTNHPSDILNRSGFDKQYEEYKQGIQLTQCVVNIFQEKCELQSNYSRALSGLSGRLRDTLSKTTGGTVHTAWLRIAAAFEMESKLNEKFSENLLKNLIGPLKDLIETLKKDKKPLKKLVDKETDNLLSLYEMEFRARQKLFSCFRNYERVYNNYVNRIDQQQHVQRQEQGENNELSRSWRSRSLNRSDTFSLCTIDSTSNSTSDHDSLKNYSLVKRNSIDYHAKPLTTASSGSAVVVNTTKSSTLASVNGNMDSTNHLSPPTTTPVSSTYSPSRLSFLYTSLPYRKCTKSSSFATADLKSNNTVRRHNSLSSGDVNTKKLLTVSKLKNAYNATLTDYYRACVSAEEARIDWHTRMLKCFNDQQTLESQRLDGLTKGLTVYRNTLDDVLPIWKAAINELANGISLADPLLDLQNFRRRSYVDESLKMSTQQLTTTNDPDSSVKSKISANVGCSLQRLIDFPSENMLLLRHHRLHEEDSQEKSSSSKSRAFNILRKKSQTINGKIKEGTSSTSAGLQSTTKLSLPLSPIPSASLRLIIQHYLTKQSMLHLLDLLAKDVEKERRTKKGLTNLVQVYAHQPAYTDMNTLMEARRRLYFSRVRLTYLTCCRQKVAHNLKQLHALETMGDSNSTCNSLTSTDIELPLCLSQAGFSKLVLDSHISPEQSNNNTGIINSSMDHSKKSYLITSRWVYLPDLDILPSHGGNLIEWPPFPVNDIVNEDLTDSVFQRDIENIREYLDTQNSYWMLENTINNDSSLETHHETTSNYTNSKLSVNGHIEKLADDNNQPSSGKEFSNNQSTFTKNLVKSSKDTRDASASRSAIPEVKKSIDTKGTLRISNTSTSESLHGSQYTPSNQSSKQVISNDKSADLSTAEGKPINPTSSISTAITTTEAKNTTTTHFSKDSLSGSRKPIIKTPTLGVDEIEAADSVISSVSSISTASITRSPSTTTATTTVNSKVSKENLTTSNFWSRFGYGSRGTTLSQQQSSSNQPSYNSLKLDKSNTNSNIIHCNNTIKKKTIIKSDISGPSSLRFANIPNSSSTDSGNSSSSMDIRPSPSRKSVHFHTDVIKKDEGVRVNDSCDMDYENWSSANFKCLGWAKVQQNYTPRQSTEICLQEGDIVSIYRKDSPDWWFGEVNGTKGRFPVSHVEEF